MLRMFALGLALMMSQPLSAQQTLMAPLDIPVGVDGAWTVGAIDDWVVFTNTTGRGDVKYQFSGYREAPERYRISVTVDLRPMTEVSAFAGLLFNFVQQDTTYLAFTINEDGAPVLFARGVGGFETFPSDTSEVARMDGTDRLEIEAQGAATVFKLNGVTVFEGDIPVVAAPRWGIVTIGAARAGFRDFVASP